jgi:hypothetical protein
MTHVLNPYQLSVCMLRMAKMSFEAQMSLFETYTKMVTLTHPAMIMHKTILQPDQTPSAQKVSPSEPNVVADKPMARKKKVSAAAKTYRNPSKPPEMPDASVAGKTTPHLKV